MRGGLLSFAKLAIAASIDSNVVGGLPVLGRGAAAGAGGSTVSSGSTTISPAALLAKWAASDTATRADAEWPMKIACSQPRWETTASASLM